ncbi:hypothetical protein EJ02DRAFT_365485 [Clathrospora elynae]|uniref:Uncharacterized protein n=1 Tax=Clathrospora elynae TaxID=706981 RepID=A0A6A5T3U9_9PLEO|nr:hypothetical protein EJ02DRAFT_365485 [Clathrospora elynae]
MSWSFQLQSINRSFERIGSWYQEFMQRTELCFRGLHERIVRLEEGEALQGPTDEQVERVLRKILAERFADPVIHHVGKRRTMEEGEHFVRNPEDQSHPRPVAMDIASLLVSPESVPSKAYMETFHMLENRLDNFPRIDLNTSDPDHDEDSKTNINAKNTQWLDRV